MKNFENIVLNIAFNGPVTTKEVVDELTKVYPDAKLFQTEVAEDLNKLDMLTYSGGKWILKEVIVECNRTELAKQLAGFAESKNQITITYDNKKKETRESVGVIGNFDELGYRLLAKTDGEFRRIDPRGVKKIVCGGKTWELKTK